MKVLLGSQGYELVTGYFDLYTLGKRLSDERVEGRGALLAPLIDAFEEEWEKTRNQHLLDACRKVLAHAPYPLLAHALLQHSGSEAHRLELLERYFDVCAWAEHPWWTLLNEPRQGPDTSLWKHLSLHVKWMAEAFKGTGKTLSGLVEPRLSAYNLALSEAHELLEGLFRHEIALSGTMVDPSVHYLERANRPGAPSFRAHVHLANGKMVVTRDAPLPEAPHARVTLKLLKRVGAEAPEFVQGPTQNPHAYQLATDIRASYSLDLAVPADLAELKQRHTLLPKGFAACAELLNLTRATLTVIDNLAHDAKLKDHVEPAWDMVKGVVALADSHQAVLKAMARPLPLKSFTQPSALQGVKLASTVLGAADGAYKIYKGSKILFSDEGDVAYEMRHGRSMRAALQTSKGTLQIVAGTMGILAAVPATAALAATPLGLLIVCGAGVAVATLDVALDATQEFEDHVHEFEKALDKAQREELLLGRFRVSASLHNACEHATQNWKA